jgi:hypothetical protein
MAANTQPIFPGTVKNVGFQLTNAMGTTAESVYSAGTNGSRIDRLNLSTTDTSAHDVNIILFNGTTQFIVATVSVAAGAGNSSGVAAKDVLDDANLLGSTAMDPFGNRVLWLGAGWSLYVGLPIALTSGKVLNVNGLAGDF